MIVLVAFLSEAAIDASVSATTRAATAASGPVSRK